MRKKKLLKKRVAKKKIKLYDKCEKCQALTYLGSTGLYICTGCGHRRQSNIKDGNFQDALELYEKELNKTGDVGLDVIGNEND